MTVTLARVLGDAWALWRRDADVLVRLAAPFVLLPALAFHLLLPAPSAPADAALAELLRLQWRFAGDHAGAFLLAAGVAEYGRVVLFVLYCDRQAKDVRAALVRGARLWPRFVLMAMMVELASLGGMLLLVLPALFVLGRTLPAGAALVSGQPASAAGAIRRAVRATAGHSWMVSGLAALLLGGRVLLGQPFAAMDDWLRSLGAPNPVARVIVNGAGAGVEMLATVAGVLVAVALYRALAGEAGASSGT